MAPAKTTAILILLSIIQISLVAHAEASDNRIENILKRLEDVETGVKENADLKDEIKDLKATVEKQTKDLKKSKERISLLEGMVVSLMHGNGDFGKPVWEKKFTSLKITRATGVDFPDNPSNRQTTEPIAFQAYMKKFHSSKNFPGGATLPFEMTTLNSEHAYNTTSGLFTAPTSGLYRFDWALAWYNQNNTSHVTGAEGDDRFYVVDVDFVIVHLGLNDTAGVENPDDNGVFMPYLSKFSGFKLSA